MTPLREAVELEMRLRGFSPRTHESYIHCLEELARYYWRPLETLACTEVQAFLDHLITVRKLAWSTINVYFSAYRFLYEQVLKRPAKEFSIPPRGRSGKRPGILSPEEVEQLIGAPPNLKHRALLAMTYGSGLRVSEVVNVQPRHIDRGRMMLFVTGKGHKDRYTILSARALQLLGDHWRADGPFEYFFHGRDKSRPMAVGTAQAIYYQALTRSGVRHVGGIHVLRHCFATFLMEAGKDIYTIKRWMGHGALVTTGRYMHVRAEHLAKVKSPLDTLYDERG
jgi:site-specific recombinase XerD